MMKKQKMVHTCDVTIMPPLIIYYYILPYLKGCKHNEVMEKQRLSSNDNTWNSALHCPLTADLKYEHHSEQRSHDD